MAADSSSEKTKQRDVFGLAIATLLTVAVFFCWNSSLLAQGSKGKSSQTSDAEWSLGAELYGWSPYPIEAKGARVGRNLGSDYSIELAHQQSRSMMLMTDLQYSESTLCINQWLSSYLYWGGGLGVRDVKFSYNAFRGGERETTAYKEVHRAITLVTHFGAEIPLLDFLSVGADLIGISFPVYWLQRQDNFPDDADYYEENPRNYPYVEKSLATNNQVLRAFMRVKF